MAKIDIRERDISPIITTAETNAAYIPGFKSDGQAMEPTLFTSVDKFIAAVKPYKFINDQTHDTKGLGNFPKAGSYDPSYLYAVQLLSSGLSILYEAYPVTIVESGDDSNRVSSDASTVNELYKKFYGENSSLDKLLDKNEYTFKFLTSGAYPVFDYCVASGDSDTYPIINKMLTIAAKRGDIIALIDHADKDTVSRTSSQLITNVKERLNNIAQVNNEDVQKYGAMFTPWCNYSLVSEITDYSEGGNTYLPGSFAYLSCVANSIKNNPNWYAVAGVTRGQINNLVQPQVNISGADADILQVDDSYSVNPIMRIKPYNYCIWGNRTLNPNTKGLVASSYLNIRMLTNDVKKVVYQAAQKLTFELNNEVLWLNFKSEIQPILDKMVSGNGLSGYKIIKKDTTKKATIEAIIRLYAIEAVENWDITIELSDSYISVE